MKTIHILSFLVVTLLFIPEVNAQPFNLDEEIKPVKLELIDDKEVEGAAGVITNATIDDKPHYWFASVDMFRPVDVYVFSNFGDPDFKVELANSNWEDVVETQNAGNVKDGITHFKIRTEGDFGIQVHPGKEKINYTIAIYANPPVKEYLGSAFRKARPGEFKSETINDTNNISETNNNNNSGNTILYVLLGIALLVIGFLLALFFIKKKTATIVILFIIGFSQTGLSQGQDAETWGPNDQQEYVDWLKKRASELKVQLEMLEKSGKILEESGLNLERWNSFKDMASKGLETLNTSIDAYNAYRGLSKCMRSTPPPGMPKIPSFCITEDCDECFLNARMRFNENRYKFERIKTIYTCTKDYTDRMIAFGDNVSGYHGISGMAWQAQKTSVLKSLEKLQGTYDSKYAELLKKQQEVLMELSACEAAHGIPDWYDRFGYMYYDFTKLNYARKE